MRKRVAILAFSGQGIQTAEQIAVAVEASGAEVEKHVPVRLASEGWESFFALAEEMEKLILHTDAFAGICSLHISESG